MSAKVSRIDSSTQQAKAVVLIERHMERELRLAELLGNLNRLAAEMLGESGLGGSSEENLAVLKPLTDEFNEQVAKTDAARQRLMERLNAVANQPVTSIKEYIDTLAPQDRKRLHSVRRLVLSKASEAQTNLMQNQAVLYYLSDFYKKYLSGISQFGNETPKYRANGQSSSESNPGNILGKTC